MPVQRAKVLTQEATVSQQWDPPWHQSPGAAKKWSKQREMWHHCFLHKDSRSCPADLPSSHLQRLTSLPSDLNPSTLPWAHCFSHNRSLLLFSQGHSCLRNFALAVLSAWCSLFPGYQQGLLLQVFTQMAPLQWCLLTVLSKIAVLLYPYIQREEFLSYLSLYPVPETVHDTK